MNIVADLERLLSLLKHPEPGLESWQQECRETWRTIRQKARERKIEQEGPHVALDLYGWIGMDEMGSGEIGLKQGLVPAGLIPLVATKREKLDADYIVQQMQIQGNNFNKTIRLARFVYDSTVITLTPGHAPIIE